MMDKFYWTDLNYLFINLQPGSVHFPTKLSNTSEASTSKQHFIRDMMNNNHLKKIIFWWENDIFLFFFFLGVSERIWGNPGMSTHEMKRKNKEFENNTAAGFFFFFVCRWIESRDDSRPAPSSVLHWPLFTRGNFPHPLAFSLSLPVHIFKWRMCKTPGISLWERENFCDFTLSPLQYRTSHSASKWS